MVDIFEEVDEHLRSDRLVVLARRYLPWVGGVLALALAIALGVWAYTSYQEKNTEAASQAYSDGLDKLGQGQFDAAYAKFAQAAEKPTAGYQALALMQQAGVRMDQKRVPEAVVLFDKAAAATNNPVIADSARLKSAFALLDTAPYDQVEARLKPLTDPKSPVSALAKETLAFAKLKAGNLTGARSDFVVLSLLPSATDDMRQRAHAAIALIDDGSVSQLNATVKASQVITSNPLFPEGPPTGAPAPTANPQPEAAQ